MPDGILQRFGKLSCYSTEDLQKELKDLKRYGGQLEEGNQLVLRNLKDKIAIEEPYLKIVLEEIFPGQTAWGNLSPAERTELREAGVKKAYKEASREYAKGVRGKFFERLNDRLGYCGWIGLMMAAIDCVHRVLAKNQLQKPWQRQLLTLWKTLR